MMAKPRKPSSKAKLDERLDRELEDSFPASDPPSLTEPEGDVRDADDRESED